MNISRVMALAVATVMIPILTGCGNTLGVQPTPPVSVSRPSPTATATESTEEPSPQPTATETETVIVKETVTASPEPTEEPTDELPPKPQKPENFIRLSGTIILVNRDESGDGKTCGRILDVVVDTRGDDIRGIQFVHFHEDDGITIQWQYAQIGDRLKMKITRDNFKPVLLTRALLESGNRPFPGHYDLTKCDDAADPEADSDDVLGPFYDTWGIPDVPYNAETWLNLPD